jgi:hypothetical protein
MIELYAITDDPAAPDPPLRAVPCGDLVVLCGPAHEGELDAEALWRHEAVVEGLMEDRNLLPVRLGAVVHDESAAAEAVAERRDELRERLRRVKGAVELAIRATGRLERFVSEIHEPLAVWSRDAVVERGADPLRAAYLVDRSEVESFVDLVRGLQGAHPDIDLVCTGPWPPYSFSERRPR